MKTGSQAVSAHGASVPIASTLTSNLGEDAHGVFVLKPMLQWGGRSNRKGCKQSLSVVWLSSIGRKRWSVFVRAINGEQWSRARVREVDSFAWNRAVCHRLEAKIDFSGSREELVYRLVVNGAYVFESVAKFPIVTGEGRFSGLNATSGTPGSKQRVVVFGDFADGTDGSTEIAKLAYEMTPDMVLIPGDLVYKSGLLREYQMQYEPVFNGNEQQVGVPLARSTVVVAAAGNHDVRLPKDADKIKPSCDEDSFAFFRIFRQPNNGPRLHASRLREMVDDNAEGLELLRCIGSDFVRRANFALYQGDVQWTVLDANKYMDWREPELQSWLRKTLSRGRNCKWRFVSFHQPGFNGDAKYKTDWRMRVLAPIFEEFGVQVVFSGHCHFYQRHRPIRYRLNHNSTGRKRNPHGAVTVDEQFDGVTNCKPQGVIYIVSGAGGSLQEPDVRPSNLEQESYSLKLCDDRNSLTVLDFEDDFVTVRQITADGQEIDRFTLRA